MIVHLFFKIKCNGLRGSGTTTSRLLYKGFLRDLTKAVFEACESLDTKLS